MEEQAPSTSSSDERFQDIAQSLAESRASAREVLSAQREDLDQLESGLSEHIRLIAQELAHDRGELDSQHSDLRDQAVLLKQQEEKLRAGQQGWEEVENEVRRQQEEMAEFLQQKQDELDQREQQLGGQDAQSQAVREEAKAAQDQAREQEQALQRSQQRIEQKEQALDGKLDKAEQELCETKSQRRRIDGELKQQRSELARERKEVEQLRKSENESHIQQTAEMSRLKEDLQSAGQACEQLQRDLAAERESQQSQTDRHDALQAEKDTLQVEKDASQGKKNALQGEKDALQVEKDALQGEKNALQAEKNALQVERDGLLQEQDRLTTELEQAQAELQATDHGSADDEELQQARRKYELALEDTRQLTQRNSELEEELAKTSEGEGAGEAELAAVRAERETLIERLAEAELKASRPAQDGEGQQKMQDLQRRFEMAVEDVRELKIANSDLKEELAAAKASQKMATPATPPVGVNLDWEAQKNRLLASLEEDFDDEDEDERQDRMTIEGTIHITDEIVADKEREIEDLQRLLEEQSSKLGGVAVGAAAIAGMLDQDELICEERERLILLQAQWKEKLSKAEIDMSVERAKMARERTELEARAESLENEIAKRAAEVVQSGGGAALSKSKGGNWLERLGLKDSAE